MGPVTPGQPAELTTLKWCQLLRRQRQLVFGRWGAVQQPQRV